MVAVNVVEQRYRCCEGQALFEGHRTVEGRLAMGQSGKNGERERKYSVLSWQ